MFVGRVACASWRDHVSPASSHSAPKTPRRRFVLPGQITPLEVVQYELLFSILAQNSFRFPSACLEERSDLFGQRLFPAFNLVPMILVAIPPNALAASLIVLCNNPDTS